MSLILEALKKSEKQRQAKSAPGGVPTAVEDEGGRTTSRWRIAAGVVAFTAAGLAIGGGVGYFGLAPSDKPLVAPPKPAAEAARPATPPVAPTTPTAAASRTTAEQAPPPAPKPPEPTPPEPTAAEPKPPTSTPPAPEPKSEAVAPAPAAKAPAPQTTPEPPADTSQAAPVGRLAGIALPRKKPAAPFSAVALPLGAGRAQTLIRRGRAYEDKGLYADAIAAYDEAINIDAGVAEAFYGRGWARMATGAYADAAKDFQSMVALRPDSADAYFGRAWALEQQGDREQAIRQYGEAIRLRPDLADAYFSRGVLEFMAGRMDAAARDFAEVRQRASGRLKDFALLWRYVSQARGGVIAPTATFDEWPDDDPWPGMLVKLFRGEATPTQVLVAAKHRDPTQQRENECIALFFLGQQRLIVGDAKAAADYFRRTLATGVTYFRQHAAAAAELKRLEAKN